MIGFINWSLVKPWIKGDKFPIGNYFGYNFDWHPAYDCSDLWILLGQLPALLQIKLYNSKS